MTRSPLFVAGHHVVVPEMSSLGVKEQMMAYAVGPSTVALLPTQEILTDINAPWPMSRFQLASIPNATGEDAPQEITVVQLHPHADYLSVGTKRRGVFLCNATNPIFDEETQLPTDMTGEYVHSVCFITDPRADGDRDRQPDTAEYLVCSSTFRAPQGHQSPHRLSVWSVTRRCIVWRGAADPLLCMCSLSPHLGFAACTADKMVTIFSIQIKDQAEEGSDGDGDGGDKQVRTMEQDEALAGRFLLVSRTCASSEAWGPRPSFVSCSAHPPFVGRRDDENAFLALAANGLLVGFDKVTGEVLKWMECKDSKSVSVKATRNYVVVCGEAIRYFDAATWEFNGKHQFDVRCWNGPLPAVVAVATEVYQSRSVSFLSNGSLLVHKITRGADAPTPHNGLHFKRLYNYLPMVDNGSDRVPPVHWIQPAVDGALVEGTPCGLWCSLGLRVVDCSDFHNASQSPLRFNCGAYNTDWNLFVAQCTQTQQLVALDPQDMWEQKASINFRCALISMSMNSEGTVAGLGEDQMLYYIACRWIMARVGCVSTLVLEPRSQRELSKGPFRSVVFAQDKLFAIGASHLMDVSTSTEHHWKENILQVGCVDSRLLLLFSSYCEFFDPENPSKYETAVTLPFSAGPASTMIVEPTQRRLVVVEESAQLLVFDVEGGGVPLLFFEHRPAIPKIKVKLVALTCAGKHNWRLIVGDSSGMVVVYGIDAKKKKKIGRRRASPLLGSERPPTVSGGEANQRLGPRGAAAETGPEVAPSSDQLSNRFSELTDFYKNQALISTPRSGKTSSKDTENKKALPVEGTPLTAPLSTPSAVYADPTAEPNVAQAEREEMAIRCMEGTSGETAPPVVSPVHPAALSEGDEEADPQPERLLHTPEKPPFVRSPLKPQVGVDELATHSSVAESIRSRCVTLKESLVELSTLLESGTGEEALRENAPELAQLYQLLGSALERSTMDPLLPRVSLSNSINSFTSGMSSMESQLLRQEMLRIQEQNRRLEAQNQEILLALRGARQ